MKTDRFEKMRIQTITPLDKMRAEYKRTHKWRWLKRKHLKEDMNNVVDALFISESLF